MSSEYYWLEKLNKKWEALPLKAIASYTVSNVDKHSHEEEIPVRLCNYSDVYKNDFIQKDMEFMVATATKDEIAKFKLEEGDILITKDSETWNDIGVPAIVLSSDEDLLCGYHLAIIKADQTRVVSRYLFHCIQSKDIRVQLELSALGVTRVGLSKYEIGRLIVPIPIDIKEQEIIVDYLDKEIRQINQLIKQKEELLTRLTEKKQVFITQAVTKGVNLKVKMKDSGFNWIGEVPQGWDIKRMKHVTSKIGSGVTPKGGAEVYEKDGVPLLRSQNIYSDGLRLDDVVFISEETHLNMINSAVYKGDILLNITGGSIGRCYYFDGEFEQANVNQHVCILRPNEKIATKYLHLLMTSQIGQTQVDLNQVGGGREGLNFDDLKSFIVPLPELSEQYKIIEFVSTETSRMNELESHTIKSVELLKERKSALITAVITGQVEIS